MPQGGARSGGRPVRRHGEHCSRKQRRLPAVRARPCRMARAEECEAGRWQVSRPRGLFDPSAASRVAGAVSRDRARRLHRSPPGCALRASQSVDKPPCALLLKRAAGTKPLPLQSPRGSNVKCHVPSVSVLAQIDIEILRFDSIEPGARGLAERARGAAPAPGARWRGDAGDRHGTPATMHPAHGLRFFLIDCWPDLARPCVH
jgi:hypothetical protein